MTKAKTKIGSRNFFINHILLLILAAFTIRLILAPFGTLELDQNTFIAWGNMLVEGGFKNFYTSWSDYLPGYLYILWFLAKIGGFLPIPAEVLFKLPAVISDLAVGYLIYLIVTKIKNSKLGLIAAAVFLFNPAVISNSTLWGQVDSLTAFFSLLAIWFATKNIYLSSFFLAFGFLVKPQAAVAVPVIFFLMVKKKWGLKKVAVYVCLFLVVLFLVFLPFASGNLINFIYDRIIATLSQYPYNSINAFNFWALRGFWQNEGSGLTDTGFLGVLITCTIGLVSFVRLIKSKRLASQYYLAAILFVANFLFFSRIHERHLLPSLAFVSVVAVLDWKIMATYVVLSATYVLNTLYSYTWIVDDFKKIFSDDLIKIFILGNLVFFGGLLARSFKKKAAPLPSIRIPAILKLKAKEIKFSDVTKKTTTKLLVLILLLSAVSRIFYLDSPKKDYFDEVYHAFTARQMLEGNSFAWEWWNAHPEGFAYEWTHPPMAKLIMAAGMSLFGENQLGWRLPGALFGVIATLLVFLVTLSLFKNRSVALVASLVFALEGLPLTLSRIGMNDIYFLTFMLLSIYLYINDNHFVSSLSLGMAAASKWSTLYALPIFLVAHFVLKKKIKPSYLWFAVVPPLVYVLAYSPLFLSAKIQREYVENTAYKSHINEKTGVVPFDMFVDTQKQMWWYHTRLKATHPFTSPWWSWPVMSRPVWVYGGEVKNGIVSNIYIMGNPIVFWFGLASVAICGYYAFSERNKKLGLVVFSYVIFFAPWAASPRIMFLYHYLPSIPFMAIAIGYVLRRNQKYLIPMLALFILSFVYFYPRFSGLPVPVQLNESYRWFEGW